LCAAIRNVHAAFAETPPLALGHISAREGGPLSPHSSHQSGRDVDISFYYRDGSGWYSRGTRDNLDLPRTWALVRALVTETDVEMILIDQSIQGLLERHALDSGENPAWVQGLFHGGPDGLRRIVRHAPGHATHLHIRFYNPVAQETGRRVGPLLAELGLRKTPASFIRHRTRPGDTLGKLAKKYGTTVQAIKSANGLRSNRIRDRRDYRIPVPGKKGQPVGPVLRFPARRLPPGPPAAATAPPRVSAR
jgi:penicillin-insensitive murein endopeptidase